MLTTIVVSVVTSVVTCGLMEAFFVRRAREQVGEFDPPDDDGHRAS